MPGLIDAIFSPKASAISDSEMRGAEAWLYDTGDSGFVTSSGTRVSESNAITLSAVFASARAIAEDVGCLPLKAYRRLEGGGKESAADEPRWFSPALGRQVNTYDLVHNEPNPDMTDLSFRSLLIWWALLWGNAYAEVEAPEGRPVALHPIHPHRVEPRRDDGGNLYYRIRNDNKEPTNVAAENMLHIQGMTDDGVVGYMMTRYAKDSFGIYMAAERFTGSFFGNGATLAGVITFDKSFETNEARQKYRESFDRVYGGARAANKWMIADGGAKVEKITSEPEKAQLVDTIKFRIEDVARWFGVPPVIIGHNTATPYANVEPLYKMYFNRGLKPWVRRIEKEFTRKLLPGDRVMFIEHVVNALMWADAKTRGEFYNLGIRGGWLLPNEARDFENMNPYEGGDRYRVEQNLAVIDESGQPVQVNQPASETGGPGEAEAYKLAVMPMFVDAAERLITREVRAFTAKKDPDAKWIDRFYEGHRGEVAAAMSPAIDSLSRLAGTESSGLAERYADMHVGESRRRLAEGDDPAGWHEDRPAWIARFLTDEVCNG
jgi:HK97 family phage portal protein